ncbi:hypothetical protein IHQ71_07700 [Rhizobium sp. TH2]|uniref:DUF4142 domain-containing protein n=1 Tax=Rhizobium sp. TH2 TaxID=2775403 RepID=UPI002156FB03|nr:DUF4142 domain-containing protein [Rhizobium sp. TH2]UVC10474.1 hypothetical protein IHQ71_07700 [Rhizobium sp. TH2]
MKQIIPRIVMALAIYPVTVSAAEMRPHQFVDKAAISDMIEIETAKIQIEKSESAKLKAFAQ